MDQAMTEAVLPALPDTQEARLPVVEATAEEVHHPVEEVTAEVHQGEVTEDKDITWDI